MNSEQHPHVEHIEQDSCNGQFNWSLWVSLLLIWIFKCLSINKTFSKIHWKYSQRHICNVIQWLCILCFLAFSSTVFFYCIIFMTFNSSLTTTSSFLKWHQIDMWFVELSTRQSIIKGNNWMLVNSEISW